MRNFKPLSDEVWSDVFGWLITPQRLAALDRSYMTFNHDDHNGYVLISENLMETAGLSCLEFHIYIRLGLGENEMQSVLMLDLPFIICGPGGPSNRQLETEAPETKLFESAPLEYLNQQNVLDAILSLEAKGLIIIERN